MPKRNIRKSSNTVTHSRLRILTTLAPLLWALGCFFLWVAVHEWIWAYNVRSVIDIEQVLQEQICPQMEVYREANQLSVTLEVCDELEAGNFEHFGINMAISCSPGYPW